MHNDSFLLALRDARILDATQFGDVEGLRSRIPDPDELARELLRRGTLTPYQVRQILEGNGSRLVLGQYVLLEVLGEGGMGQVFKARHQRMKRLVALKVIRKDLAVGPEDIQRFTQEIEAAAALAHPNVVMAFDANEIDGTLFFVMEYVEGIDLGKLVKQHGPPTIGQACDYIRQAAIGLQHAHQRGLVHRDIKPSNLLLTYSEGLVKVLDMGLARLQEAANNQNAQLTGTGVIMGTPDFMSPEQARDSRGADIRSDLYSLGCSLYYLLTRQVPFPGGTITEKLLRHNIEEPKPLTELRPEVPGELAGVVSRLMAKHPADRFPTPADAAAALAPFAAEPSSAERYRPASEPDTIDLVAVSRRSPSSALASETPRYASLPPARMPAPASSATNSGTMVLSSGAPVSSAPSGTAPWRPAQAAKRRVPLLVPVLLAALLLGGVGVGVVLLPKSPSEEAKAPVVAERPPEPKPTVTPLETPPAPKPPEPIRVPEPPPKTPETKPETPAVVQPKPPEPAHVETPPPAKPPEPVKVEAPAPLLGVLVHFDRPQQAATLRASLSTNGEWAVVGYDNKVHVWPLSTTRREDRPAENLATTFAPAALSILADGSRVLMGRPADDPSTPDGKVPPVLNFVSTWDPKVSRHEQLLRGHKDAVTAVALSPRGNFALSGSADRTVRVWDLNNRSPKMTLGSHEQKISCVASSADGSRGLSADWGGKVILWDLEAGVKLATFEKHKNIVSSLAFSPSGKYAVSAGYDGYIYLYDLEKKEPVRSYEGQGDAVKCLAFAPDGAHFVSGGDDKTLRLWNVNEREPVRSFDEHNVGVLSVAVAADGKYVVFICADHTIRRCELSQR